MKINNIFKSIQGEGRHAGEVVLFIRMSGCTRECSYCDTKYHKDGYHTSYEKLIKHIKEANVDIVVWTGGEPLIQREVIYDIMKLLPKHKHHVETNGDLLQDSDCDKFHYVGCSPKDLKTTKKVSMMFNNNIVYKMNKGDIKVVTDLKTVGVNMLKYASTIMPLSVDWNGPIDKQIEKDVWNYCVKHNKRFSMRQHIKIWGTERGV